METIDNYLRESLVFDIKALNCLTVCKKWLIFVGMLTKESHGEHKKVDRKTYIFK